MSLFLLVALLLTLVGGEETQKWFPVADDKNIKLSTELRFASEGLAHDDEYWYLNSKKTMYKCVLEEVPHKKIEYKLRIVSKNNHAIPDELKALGYNHIGDIDVEPSTGDGKPSIIYGGIEYSSTSIGYLAAWNAETLEIIRYAKTEQQGMPWVAIDTTERLIYSTHWNDRTALQVYNLDTFEFIRSISYLDQYGVGTLPGEIQGAAFMPNVYNKLYVAVNGNCSVYSVDLYHEGRNDGTRIVEVLRDDNRKKWNYEMEGITFYKPPAPFSDTGFMHLFGNFEGLKDKVLYGFNHLYTTTVEV